ncbi:hypothetical protein [Kordia sp.]|uniref:hypothetical protein n=1 Tax=Kordia sp. TaxID=1965332 RepID=UPI003B5CB705
MRLKTLKKLEIKENLLQKIVGGSSKRNTSSEASGTEAPITDPNKEVTEEEDAHANKENS